MKKILLPVLPGLVILSASPLSAQFLIQDSFETNNAANYTVLQNAALDSSVNFAFDYINAGIPLAPRSAPGDRFGLRFTANDTVASADGITAFNNTFIGATSYRLTVDVFMAFTGTSGTTEHGHVGVGGNGTVYNSIFTPISGSGSFLAFTGDGGSGSDFRWYLDTADGGPSTVPAADASYLAGGSDGALPLYQTLFPSPPSTIAGSPGNIWATLSILVDAGIISYSFNGTKIIEDTYTGSLDGLASLGLVDTFTSVDSGTVFTVYDNFAVEVVPEPSALTLAGLVSLGLLSRRRRA